jgi:catechol 2,3-dioxygenase-like lactoylglutathione lyase family enzyme
LTDLVKGVDFAFVAAKDFEAARKFYGEMLGLPCPVEYGRTPGAEFETGNLTLVVMETSSIGMEFEPSGSPIAFHVDDVAAARAELEAKGVEFSGEIVDSGVCHQAYFKDPDGNALILHHRYAPTPPGRASAGAAGAP